MIDITNSEFLKLIFGDEWNHAHVTAFKDDPGSIEADRRAICWGGGAAGSRLESFGPGDNQYFTISLFNMDEGRAVRRKAKFDACFVIVADDVNEKLPLERVEMLPAPTYKLLTSAGSEQWGWVLGEACEDRGQVENLLDGLVVQGLAPDGKDPGMRGVTRYVRLPEGSNTKTKRYVDGVPFKCSIIEWNPDSYYSIETLASVFDININAERSSAAGAGLSAQNPIVRDHPVMKRLNFTGEGNDGWLRVDCPNAENHTGGEPDGAAVQVQEDGRIHFQCHHGSCNGDSVGAKKLTGPRVISLLDTGGDLLDQYDDYCKRLYAKGILSLKKSCSDEKPDITGFDPNRYIFIAAENKFYDIKSRLMISTKGLDNRYLSELPPGRNKLQASALLLSTMDKKIGEADGITWTPTGREAPTREELIVDVEGRNLINTWSGFALKPCAGDVSLWLEHWEYLVPDERQREETLNYLAAILQRPTEKPAFFIGHRGGHRTGKDLAYKPIMQALGYRIAKAVEIDNVISGWGDYLNEVKFCIVTEVDKAQDKKVANSMKTITAPTASGYRILNMKGGSVVTQRDCMGGVMMSNKRHFIAIEEGDRRYFIIDSWVKPRSAEYYKKIDSWYNEEGTYGAILGYLLARDISNFDHNQLPYMTEAANEMVEAGRYDYEQDIREMIDDRVPPFHNTWVGSKEVKRVRGDMKLKGGNNGIDTALADAGWFKFRGLKKVGGVVKNTQTFYTNLLPRDAKSAEAFAFMEEHKREIAKIG